MQTKKIFLAATCLTVLLTANNAFAYNSFLSKDEVPDAQLILSGPPAYNSFEFQTDKAIAENVVQLRGTPRWEQAIKDAEVKHEHIGPMFSEAFGMEISKEKTPILLDIMVKLHDDAGVLPTDDIKNKHKRLRPFMLFDNSTCTPAKEPALRKNGSYPSGHSAYGWAMALVLAEIRPERQHEILNRGLEIGQSRVICNVHWQSDVNDGRLLASTVVARLHGNPAFLKRMEEAKQEISAILAKSK